MSAAAVAAVGAAEADGKPDMDPQPVLLATKNPGKARELAALIAGLGFDPGPAVPVLSLAEWESQRGALTEPEEGEDSFEANARLKARSYAAQSGHCVLADDSGLSVVALGGAPGVLSARYGGPGLDDGGRSALLLENMRDQTDRRAWFTSALALARPDGAALTWTGRLDGLIARRPAGQNGFGYDPVFYYPPSRRTLAQLSAEEKNRLSHRARAALAFQRDSHRIARFLAAAGLNSRPANARSTAFL